ncbi:uncharacterized protein LOC122754932 [Dromiciops gliroides]|uniref:uncharacterized protein LOC122754932 n=1 Tax=Dromiciops gliroides TaxID=33562 RepID=UPI001CC68DF7|nr:uncharacterized protein LOC122754932 [Dromiciops gliroides]
MLYLQIEAQRAKAKRLQKEKELRYPEIRNVPEKKGRSKSAGYSVEIWDSRIPEEKPGSSLSSSTVPDSEWVKLSPQEKLSWAKSTQDPRIALGHQSPLEKKIVSLGGLHTPAARNLLAQRHKEEHEVLSKEKAMSFDYRLAKAENYYYTRIMEMMEEQNEFKKPRIEPDGVQKTPSMRKQIREWDRRQQMKEHLERMIRGREFNEERNKERLSVRIPSHPPPFQKRIKKKNHKRFGWNTAYPLLQPQDASPIEVDVLVEESPEKKDVFVEASTGPASRLLVPVVLLSLVRFPQSCVSYKLVV